MSDVNPTELLSAIVGDGLTVEDLKDAVVIDVNALVEECSIQPYYYAIVGKMLVESKMALKRLSNEADLIKASEEASIREKPGDFGITKITEKVVASTLVTQPEVIEIIAKLEAAEAELNAAHVLVNVFEQRKGMLKGEVELFTTKLYNETVIRGKEMGEFREEVAKKRTQSHERDG